MCGHGKGPAQDRQFQNWLKDAFQVLMGPAAFIGPSQVSRCSDFPVLICSCFFWLPGDKLGQSSLSSCPNILCRWSCRGMSPSCHTGQTGSRLSLPPIHTVVSPPCAWQSFPKLTPDHTKASFSLLLIDTSLCSSRWSKATHLKSGLSHTVSFSDHGFAQL